MGKARSKLDRIQVGSGTRYFRVQYPDRDVASGLIFAFHGFTQTALAFERKSGLSSVATEAGCVVLYPRGLLTSWFSAFGGRDQDLAFFDALYHRFKLELNLDSSQIFLTGISDGAYFANWLGIQRSTEIGALCSHSGGIPKNYSEVDDLNLPNKYRVLIVQGDQDNLVPQDKAEDLQKLYLRSGHSVQYRLIQGLRHQWADEVNQDIVSFFLAGSSHQTFT